MQIFWDEKKNHDNVINHKVSFQEAETQKHMEENRMRKEYDFSNAKKNPYIKKLRKQISIRIDVDTINLICYPDR